MGTREDVQALLRDYTVGPALDDAEGLADLLTIYIERRVQLARSAERADAERAKLLTEAVENEIAGAHDYQLRRAVLFLLDQAAGR